ncbi:MAG: pyridoxal phosphate-dependent decarboxylase family protein [Natronomonas sp.]
MSLPESGRDRERVLADLESRADSDADWRNGRTWNLVYHAGEAVESLRNDAYELFASENALNPGAFPSLGQCEVDIVEMTTDLLSGSDDVVGNVTSGGTESILLAVYTAREHARRERGITESELVVPETAHPAWSKAGHYFGVDVIRTPVREDRRADVDAVEAAVTDRTAMVVGSAPAYPHGVVDPIADLGRIAAANDMLCHVDACLGGFILPFLRDLGHDFPAFDFSVPGVTSMSADPHKYGYAPKGSSVLLWRTPDIRLHQYFGFQDWHGGVYVAPNMQGTRPGGPIAGTWAVMQYLGRDGYADLTATVMDTAETLRDRIEAIDGLSIVANPDATVFAIESTDPTLDVWAVHERLTADGWVLERQQQPPSIHLSVMPTHEPVVEEFCADLEAAAEDARSESGDSARAPMYGLSADLDSDEEIERAAERLLDSVFR